MANVFIKPDIVAKEMLMQVENQCVLGKIVHRGYESEFNTTSNGYKNGDSVRIKAPVYFRTKDGPVIDLTEIREEDTTFTVSFHKTVAWPVSVLDMTLSIDKMSERYLQPAALAIANDIDISLAALYKEIPNQVGTPGVTPQNFLTFAQAKAVLMDHACPQDNLYCVIDSWAEAYLKDNLKGVFNPQMSNDIIRAGNLGSQLSGFHMYTSQNIQTHTCGTAAGLTTNLVDGTNAEASVGITIDQNGSWSNTLTAGDIFTVAAVNGVNPISGANTGKLRQFVSMAAVTDAGNDQLISTTPGVAPYMIYSASATETALPYQNVDALPQDGAVITIAGTASLAHKVNLAFHKNALSLAMVPLVIPASAPWQSQISENGFSISICRDFDIVNYREIIRFDALWGVKVLNPFLACRIAG
jgi:hypothetical protein